MWVSLGLWHNYKQATLEIYKTYALTFIAPLFHVLFPGTTFYLKPKLVHAATILTYMRLSYKYWSADLKKLANMEDLPPASRAHVDNLHILMEFFLPTVSHMCMKHEFVKT